MTACSEPGDQHSALVLASASPRRRELLAALGIPFIVVNTDTDETVAEGEPPSAAAVRLARQKAEAAARTHSSAVVLGADTIVVLDGRILGKPADATEAAAMLRDLRDRDHHVITGIALLDAASAVAHTAAPATLVTMRAYTDGEIAASIAAGTPFDKAGAYAIQDEVFRPVARFKGCYCTVMGLPLWSVYHLLRMLHPELAPASPDTSRHVCAGCPLA